MSENNFTELYKTWSADLLLDIVDNPNDYQSLAVQAAQQELNSRQLSVEQFAEAKAIQAERQKANRDDQQKTKAIQEKVTSISSSVADTLNPIQEQPASTDKIIKGIALFFGGMFLYNLYTEFEMLKFMFTNNAAVWGFEMILVYLSFMLLPVMGILIWLKKKWGWVLAALYFSYQLVGSVSGLITELKRTPGNSLLDALSPPVSPSVYITLFLIFTGLTWLITKENIRAVYRIDRKTMFITIGLGVVITSPLLIMAAII